VGAQRAMAPVLSGSVPPLAVAYHGRQETGFGLADGLRPGETILLVPAAGADPSGGRAAGGAIGGTGKTQLAAGFARALWSERAVDLLVWVTAGHRTSIVASYAQAAVDLDIIDSDESADTGAQRFLGWLRGTERRWAVVLDGVMSPADLDGLWPRGPSGQVVVTTQLRAEALGGHGPGRTAWGVPGFSRREALGYLNSRLTAFPDQRIGALDLAEDLGGLPIALAQAAAVIELTDSTCRDYRTEYGQRLRITAGTLVDGCPQSLLATWSLAVEHAYEQSPAGVGWAALVFASALDSGGIPAAVLTSPAACGYLTGRWSGEAIGLDGGTEHEDASEADQNLVRDTYARLARFGLLSVDTTSAVRTVLLHPAVRAAVRAYLAPGTVEQVVQAAATALIEAWPGDGTAGGAVGGAVGTGARAQLGQALRDCTAALLSFGGDLLWKPDAHPVLLRAGTSLAESPPLREAAIDYWQAMTATCTHLLGHGHGQSVQTRDMLADAYASAGRLSESLAVRHPGADDTMTDAVGENPRATTE
jgi:hypothetical protein